MLKYFLLILFLICTAQSYSVVTIPFKDPKADQVFIILGTGMSMNLANYIKLKPSDFKKLTGHKLTLKETIAFKITQKRIKKTIRKDGSVNLLVFNNQSKEPFKWHWGGFFLGMLVPVGFIITLFIKDEKRKDRITSSLFGMAIVLSLGFLIGIMITANNI